MPDPKDYAIGIRGRVIKKTKEGWLIKSIGAGVPVEYQEHDLPAVRVSFALRHEGAVGTLKWGNKKWWFFA